MYLFAGGIDHRHSCLTSKLLLIDCRIQSNGQILYRRCNQEAGNLFAWQFHVIYRFDLSDDRHECQRIKTQVNQGLVRRNRIIRWQCLSESRAKKIKNSRSIVHIFVQQTGVQEGADS
jgi:hypothetical protein